MKTPTVLFDGQVVDLSVVPDPVAPTYDVNVGVIAESLSKQCRFNGHCKGFYSVAEHSVLVSHLIDPEYALAGLMHDVHEILTGDIPTPVKSVVPQIKLFEERADLLVSGPGWWAKTCKARRQLHRADRLALCIEYELLMAAQALDIWDHCGMSPRWTRREIESKLRECGFGLELGREREDAKALFLARYEELAP